MLGLPQRRRYPLFSDSGDHGSLAHVVSLKYAYTMHAAIPSLPRDLVREQGTRFLDSAFFPSLLAGTATLEMTMTYEFYYRI